ncbi:MAG: protein kinase [Defluviitaleaceae bacterium]|nr:protein kinase [Defluviitaleaceae bacterium]
MSSSLASEVLVTFEGYDFPLEIIRRFDVIELLSQNEMGETYLLSEKDSSTWFVLKSFRHSVPISPESEILKGLEHKGLPTFEPQIKWGETQFTLRKYVVGISLHEYINEHQVLDEAQVLYIIKSLCETIGFLHSQKTPIIHRDIKPSNVIINPRDNSVTLIDFGIARKYNENSNKDTTVFATIEFAPPEQFGFAQTDTRTDIYALGVLLRFMLTGMTDHNTHVGNRTLDNIIKKCTALDPKKRFQSITALQKSLNRYKPQAFKRVIGAISAILVVGLIFFVGYSFGLGQLYTPTPPIVAYPLGEIGPNPQIYEFREPLIEATVRLILGKEPDESVALGELEAITEIRIQGAYPIPLDAYNVYYAPPGDIMSLEDLRFMPNLRNIGILDQPFYDLSPLADNMNIHTIVFDINNVSDLSPISALPYLRRLVLYSTLITDWTPLERMRNLTDLWLGGERVIAESISDLGDISHLALLQIAWTDSLVSLEGIQYLQWLNVLKIQYTGVTDFSLLNDVEVLPNLEHLTISSDMEQYLHTFTRDDVDVIIYRHN